MTQNTENVHNFTFIPAPSNPDVQYVFSCFSSHFLSLSLSLFLSLSHFSSHSSYFTDNVNADIKESLCLEEEERREIKEEKEEKEEELLLLLPKLAPEKGCRSKFQQENFVIATKEDELIQRYDFGSKD
jgi:hypothetical protein